MTMPRWGDTDDSVPRDAALLAAAAELQAEARLLLADLGLVELLGMVGEVVQVGSSVMGLVVWCDLDLVVHSPELTTARVFETLHPLLVAPGLLQLDYRDQQGPRSLGGDPRDSRHYVVLRHAGRAMGPWKIDLTFWTAYDRHDHEACAADVATRLTPETRLVILRLKYRWHRRPSYPEVVGGHEIYDAVLNHGVRNEADFEVYLRARDLPVNWSRSECEAPSGPWIRQPRGRARVGEPDRAARPGTASITRATSRCRCSSTCP